jgi:hypothetical protein
MSRAQRRAERAAVLREGRRRARATRWRSPRHGVWVAEVGGRICAVRYLGARPSFGSGGWSLIADIGKMEVDPCLESDHWTLTRGQACAERAVADIPMVRAMLQGVSR